MTARIVHLVSVTLFIVLFSASNVQATTYYTGSSGSPTSLSIWWTATNGTGTHPANFTTAGDIFTIQSGHILTTTSTWTVTGTLVVNTGGRLTASSTMNFGALTINSGGIVTMNRSLTVNAATTISGTINFGATSSTSRTMRFTGNVVLNSGAVWSVPATGNGANNLFIFAGNFTNNATTFNDLGTGVHTFSGAAKTISGSTITSIRSVSVTGTPTNTGTLTVRTVLSGTGTLTNGNGTTGTLNIGGSASITGLNATAANNLVNYTGVAQTAKVTTYNNLIISGSLAKTFATSPTVNGILSMEGTATIAVTTGVVTYGANATLKYNTATSRTTSSEEWITPFAATGGVLIANTGAIIMNEAKAFNASIPLSISSGATLDTKAANSFSLTLGGNFVNNGGTFTAYASPIIITNTMTTQSIAGFTTTGSVTLSKTAGTATMQGNVNGGLLTINGTGGTLNLGAGLTHAYTGDVNLLNGTLNGASSILHVNNSSTTAWSGNGSNFTAGSGTVNFGGLAQSLAGTGTTTFNNLTVSNSGLKSFVSVPVVNGVFSIEGTATVSVAPTYGSAATLKYNTATSRTTGSEWITPFVASGGVVIASTGTISMTAAKVFNSTSPLTVNSGSSLSMSTFLLTLNGNLVNLGGSASGTTGGVTITGSATQSIGAFTTTGTISMTKSGNTATLTGNVNGAALTINGSGGTLNLGTALTHTMTGDITLTAGTLNGGSSILNENSASSTAWNGTASVFVPSSGTVNFGAAGNQSLAASSLSFHNLAFSGSGNKTFSVAASVGANLSISGTAVADPGTIDHSANSLTLGGTNQATGTWGSTASGAYYKNDTYFLSTATGVLNVSCNAPAAPTSGGNEEVCSGQTIPALSVTVGGGETADWYSLADGGTALVTNSLTYTPSAAGTYYAETRIGSCISVSRTGVTLTLNASPTVLSLTGSSICTSPGGNGTITSTTSVTGVNYQMFNGSDVEQGTTKPGTGSGLTWTGLDAGTGYYVVATHATTSCSSASGAVNISENGNPSSLALTGSTICTSPGDDGTIVSTTSVTGVDYQLFDDSDSPVQAAQPGTGEGLIWSNLMAGTGYYVIGTDATSLCVSSSSNAVNVATVANPGVLALTGSTVCVTPGDDGTITSTTSQAGVDYQLYDNGDLEIGPPVPGTGSALSWSGLPASTGYYATGTHATTFCISENSNIVDVSTNPNPTITISATAAAVCFSTGAQNTTLAYSAVTNAPAQYTITWNAAANAAGLVDAGPASLPATPVIVPVAANVAGGVYSGTLTVTNANDCASSGNSFTLAINTAPVAPTGTTIQILCNGATVSNLTATGAGIAWYASPAGGAPLSGSLVLVNGTHYYASQTVNGCESSSRLNVTALVVSAGSWIGATSTDWFTATNWCGGTLPASTTNVIIAAGLSRYPSIGTTGAVCNSLTIEPGGSLVITGTNTLTVSGNWTNNGTFTANGSTINFNGTGPGSINAGNFNNVTFSGAGTKTAAGSLVIAGNVIISNNFTAGSFTHSVGGTWTNTGTFTATGSTINFNGSIAATIGAGNFNNITFSGAGAKSAAGALTIAGNVSITGNFTAGSFTHEVGGNWSKSGTFTATGSTINFNGGSSPQGIGACNFNNISFSNAGVKTAAGSLAITGNIIISSNFSAGSYTHTLLGDWTNNGSFTANSSTFAFNGAAAQNIGGASAATFHNFTQSGTGIITLGIPMSLDGTLTLTLGLIDIGNHNLTVTPTGSVTGGSSDSYVKTSGTGRLKQSVAGNGTVTKNYPVGNSAYNPMSVKFNDMALSDNFSIRVEDGAILNANSSKTVNRKWYLIGDAAGTADLTLAATYNSGEEGSGFSNLLSPQIGYFDGTSWAYRPVSSGAGTTTFTASGSAPDFTNTTGYFVLGSGDAFTANKLAVTQLTPVNPSLGVANTIVTVQAQNSSNVPTMVIDAAGTSFSLSAANTTMSTTPSGIIGQYAYETSIPSVEFTQSTLNTGNGTYNHDATVTATRTAGESLSAGTSAAFDVYEGAIYEPVATENWNAANGWRKSTNGGTSWTNPASLPTDNLFASNDLIRVPAGITLTANVTASCYSLLIYGILDISSSGSLTLNHSEYSDYNIHVHEGTLKNSGGTLTNTNTAHPVEIHGGTYEHAMNGGSIPVSMWSTSGVTPSTCHISGITSTALTAGLDQTFENFTWDNASQTVTQNLSADMVVNGVLALTFGKITTGSYHVIVGLTGTTSNSGAGYIDGTLRRYVASTVTTGDFPVGDANYYAPFSISCTGTPSGNGYLDVSTVAAQPPLESGLSQANYINRKWTVANNGVTGITAYSPGCTFAEGDKVGSPATASLKLRKLTLATWFTTNGAATGNTITATGLSTAGLTAASDFYAGEDDCTATKTVWLGSTSTNWNTAGNWCNGSVPTSATDVTIPAAPSRQPVIGSGGGRCSNLVIENGANLTISGSYALDVHAAWSNNGTFTAGIGTVSFTGSSTQTITGETTFTNLTLDNAAGVTAANDITVNGDLTLASANKDDTHGTLDMGSHTLIMLSESATIAGAGDVTGIVKRHHTFTPNIPYQFGSQYTTLNFLNTGTQPDEISCRISIGAAPWWRTSSVKRVYSFAQTGTTGSDRVSLNLGYLTSELNSNDETKLVLWDHHYTGGDTDEHGKSNNSATEHWVGLSGRTIAYVASVTIDDKEWGVANYSATKNTWIGVLNTDWDEATNWTGGHVPLSTEDVLIPDVSAVSNRFPVLSSDVAIKSLEIASGASLSAGTYSMTINGYLSAWDNKGTFDPGTGTVLLTHGNLTHIVAVSGTTQFHNVTVAANTFIKPGSGTIMKISGDVYGDISSIVDLSAYGNTVEYNGTVEEYNGTSTTQYIVNPSTAGYDFRGYYNLIISGTGVKTLVDNLDLSGNYTTNGTLDAGTGTVSFIGTTAQLLSGSVAPVFHHLTINNPAGVSFSTDVTVNGILLLESPNPSLFSGSLVMNPGKILNMGDAATTTGTGDATGMIKRTPVTSFAVNTEYSFGNEYTVIIFPDVAGQTLPSEATVKVTLGYPASWGAGTPPNSINRILDVAQVGGSGTRALIRSHYRDDEVPAGVNPNLLSMWIYKSDLPLIYEKGKSNINTTIGYITVQDVNLVMIPSDLNDFHVAFAPSLTQTLTWNGSQGTEWTNAANWTPNNDPAGFGVLIPDANTTPYSPELSVGASCKSVIIESSGVLTTSIGATLSLTGQNNLWNMETNGTFNAGNSTVTISNTASVSSLSGSTGFYNLTVATGASLQPAAGSYLGISGALTLEGTAGLDAISNSTTIEFNGTGVQTIPALSYHNLIISGARATHDITLASGGTISITGSFHPTATFTSGKYVVSGSTVNFSGNSGQQNIPQSFTFNNFILNNNEGVSLSDDVTVTGTLSFTAGKITTGANHLIIGSSSPCSSGIVTGAGDGKYVFGNLRRFVPNDTDPTVMFDIGDLANYTPVAVDFSGTASGCGFIDAATFIAQPPVVSGLSQAKYIYRQWSLINTDVAGFTSYDATFTFVDDDKVGNPNTSGLVVRKWNGFAWSTTTAGARTSNSTQCTDLTTFSDFAIGEDACSGISLWLGGTSTDWQTEANWCSGSTPGSSDDVVIPSGTPYQPHIGSSGNGSCRNITIYEGAGLTMDGAGLLDVHGNWTNNGTFTGGASTIHFTGTAAQTITGATTFSTLKVNNANGVTLGSDVTVNTLTIGDVISNSVFNDGGFQITGGTGTLTLDNSGTLKLGNGTAATTFPAFSASTLSSGTVDYGSSSLQTIAAAGYTNVTNTGNGQRTLAASGTIGISGSFAPGNGSYTVTGSTIDYNGTTAQTVRGFTYNNLTVSGSGNNSKTADGDITVNGILNLNSANASSTQGALHMVGASEYVLYMGAYATTTGSGDVTGYVNRSYFQLDSAYTFGNRFTLIKFTVGPLPASVTLEVYLTSSDLSWKPDAIHRYMDVVRTGGSAATRLRFNFHYLDAELNGADENNLDLFDYHVESATLHDHGRTDYNTSDNWVGFGNVGLAFLGTASADDHFWTLGTSTANNECTWIGGSPSGPTDWDLPGNWEGGVPLATSDVIIPGGRTYYPVLPAAAMPDGSLAGGRIVNSIDIQTGGVLDAATGIPVLNITGAENAWQNNGTLNAGASTIVFSNAEAGMSGETSFNNVTVADEGDLTPGTGSIMRIGGVLSVSATGVLNAATFPNTIEYHKSGDQTVLNPNGSPAGYSTLVLGGSGTKILPAAELHVSGNFTTNNSSISATGNTFVMNGLNVQSMNGSAGVSLNNLAIANTSATVTAGVNLTCTGELTNSGVLDMTTKILAVTGTITNTGTIRTSVPSATSSVPLPAGRTWGGTIEYYSGTSQTAVEATYNNLTISGTGGATANADIIVGGVLNLDSNPDATHGALDMGSYSLHLGVAAVTTGTGDVTGIIKRTHTFATNTFYSYGNTNQGVLFTETAGQSLPSSVSVRVTIGAYPCWGLICASNPVDVTRRFYELDHVGGTGTKAILRTNYLDSELAAGVNESLLSAWSYYAPGPLRIDQGWSGHDVINNYLSVSDVNFGAIPTGLPGDFQVAIAPTSSNFKTWDGSESSDWNTAANWTPSGVPTENFGAVIPDVSTVAYPPSLPANGITPQAICQYLLLESSGLLNSGESDGATITIVDGIVGDAWGCESGATFNAGNSTVIFANNNPADVASVSGSTNFYNVTIATDSKLTPAANCYMGIAGTLAVNGTFSVTSNINTIEFKGSGAQLIPNPNGVTPGYHHLVFSGAGTKTLSAALNVAGNLTNNGATVTTTGNTVSMNGTSAQFLDGTTGISFNNLTINNSAGILLGGADETVTGTLTLTSGKLTLGSSNLVLNTLSAIAGNPGTGAYILFSGTGNLVKNIPATMQDAYHFPVGTASAYSPATFKLTSGAVDGTSSMAISLAEGKQSNIGSAPAYINRYWTYTPTGTFTSPVYDASFTYVDGDIVGHESTIKSAKFDGDWTLYSLAIAGSNRLDIPGATSFSDYTGFGDLAVAPAASGNPICSGNSTTISAHRTGGKDAMSYAWTVPGGVTDPGDVSGFDATVPGTYSVTVTDADGATANGSMILAVDALPTAASAGNDQQKCSTGTFTLEGNAASVGEGTWTFQSGTGDITSPHSAISEVTGVPAGTIPTVLRWTIINGACSSFDDVSLTNNARQKISGAFTYYNLANTPLATADKTVVLYRTSVEPDNLVETKTGVSGSYEFANLCPENTYYILATSTMDANGSVNTTDAAQVNYYGVFTPYSIEKVRFHAGDVGTSGTDPDLSLTATDAGRIQQHFVNGTAFDNTWRFWQAGAMINSASTSESYPSVVLSAGSDKTVNMYGLCTGDFNRSFIPGGMKSASSTMELHYLGTVQAGGSEVFELPVRMVHASEVGAVSLVLNFPDDLVEIEDVHMNSAAGRLDWAVNGNELRIGWNSRVPETFEAFENIFILKLRTTAAFSNGKTIRLALAADPLNELADGNYGVIPDAALNVSMVESSANAIAENAAAGKILLRNYPNPFTGNTTVSCTLPVAGKITIDIHNALGTVVKTFHGELQAAGDYSIKFDATNLAPGIYTAVIRLNSDNTDLFGVIKLIKTRN